MTAMENSERQQLTNGEALDAGDLRTDDASPAAETSDAKRASALSGDLIELGRRRASEVMEFSRSRETAAPAIPDSAGMAEVPLGDAPSTAELSPEPEVHEQPKIHVSSLEREPIAVAGKERDPMTLILQCAAVFLTSLILGLVLL
jgi:hypothetical protein